MAPLVYNFGIIAGGAIFGRRYGISSLAWGALAGAIAGPFAVMVVAGWRAGMRYRPTANVRDPEFREWLWASIPLMLGVSLVTADDWFIRFFAAADLGAISCLNYARKLVQIPIAVAGQAVGQASMPFFAQYWAEGRKKDLGDLGDLVGALVVGDRRARRLRAHRAWRAGRRSALPPRPLRRRAGGADGALRDGLRRRHSRCGRCRPSWRAPSTPPATR